MKKIVIITFLAGLILALFGPAAQADAATNDAARRKHKDTPGCVTKAEFRSIRKGMTLAQVRRIFDTPGRTTSAWDTSYSDWVWGDYVEGYDETYWVDGYWDDYLTYVDGYYDEDGNWFEGHYEGGMTEGYWSSYWVDGYWEDDYEIYVSQVDYFRDYKKCKSFQHGRGRVAINLDNYSSARSGLRVFSKFANRPTVWNTYGLRTTQATSPVAGKDVPKAEHAGPSKHSHEVTPEPAQPKH